MSNQPLTISSWPRAIHPELKGRPVITGRERGIVAAASYEAKARGVQRGVRLSKAALTELS